MSFFVNRFKRGKWIDKSNSLLSSRSKVLSLLALLVRYMSKGGLGKVRDDLSLLGSYIGNIIRGRYRDYNGSSLTLAVAAVIYVVSPLDVVPDILPIGFLDDIAIVSWALSRMSAELDKFRQWRTASEASGKPVAWIEEGEPEYEWIDDDEVKDDDTHSAV